MNGLKINAEGRPNFPNRKFGTIGYGFDELINPIAHIVSSYYPLCQEMLFFIINQNNQEHRIDFALVLTWHPPIAATNKKNPKMIET